MTKRNHEGDLATLLRESVVDSARALGLGPAVCADLAAQAEERFRQRAGGEKSYIGSIDRRKRDAAIRQQFNGCNLAELARTHGLTPRRVQQILGKQG